MEEQLEQEVQSDVEAATQEVEEVASTVSEPTFTQADLDRVREEARQELLTQQAPIVQADPGDEFDAIADQWYTESPAAALRKAVELGKKQTLAEISPILNQLAAKDVVAELAGNDPHAREYINQFGSSIAGVQNADPRMKELLTRAARDYANEKRPKTVSASPAYGEPAPRIGNADREMMRALSKALGTELTDADYAEAMKLQ
jgi:hypothetical protein